MDRDRLAKEVAEYVHRGLRAVCLHGVRAPGVCTCWKGSDCASPGKHPTGLTWGTAVDEEQVFELWGSSTPHNVGVMLGNAHRGAGGAVIDIESDSDEGNAELRRLGLDRYETPTWSSGRGLHRLFLWSPDLPDMAVLKPNGMEVRIGGGGKMAQSVMPPSTHHTGRPYAWLPGFSLADVEIAPIPDNVMAVILEEVRRREAGVSATTAERRSMSLLRGPVSEGGRNDALFDAACLFAGAVNPSNEEHEQFVLDALWGVNSRRCKPSLNEHEVVSIFRSAMKYRREDLATEALFPGVEAVVEGMRTLYRPAGLELTIHQGDPTTFELRCDSLRQSNGTGVVRVTADVWTDPRRMRDAMIDAFPGVPFDRFPGDFARIWSGLAPKPGTRTAPATEAVTGLRILLENEAVAAGRRVEVTDPAEHATRRLIGLMMMRLDSIAEAGAVSCETRGEQAPSDDEVLAELVSLRAGGWVGGRLWFAWDRLWRDIGSQYGIDRDAAAKVARAIPEIIGRKLKPERFQRHGTRATLRSLTAHEMELLRTFAAGGAAAARGNTYGPRAGAPESEKGVAGEAATQENAV
jgi:hypothetical protein